MQAVILAAGKGKRLHPITATRTKAMAPILGKPIVERVMDPLVAHGIQDFCLVTSPDDTEIEHYFQSKTHLQAAIHLIPQLEPLGMGHALLQAVPYIGEDFILSACDNLVEVDQIQALLASWATQAPDAILTTLRVGPKEIIRMGIIAQEGGRVTRIVEKPSLAEAPSNIGSVPLYIFSRKILAFLGEIKPSPRGEYELQDAIQNLIDQGGDVQAFELTSRRDLTTPEDLLSLNLKFLAQETSKSHCIPQAVGSHTRLIQPIYLEEGVRIGRDCLIGPNVYIETGVTLGDQVQLENAVVLRHRKIADQVTGKNQVIW